MNKLTATLVSVLLAVGLCLLVWSYVDPALFVSMFMGVSWGWFLAAWGLFLLYQVFRTLRFRLLTNADGGFFLMFNTQCMHALVNGFLPVGLGEVAFVYLLKRFHGMDYNTGAASLIVARFIDLALFTFLFALISVFYFNVLPESIRWFAPVMLCGLLVVAAVFIILIRARPGKAQGALANSMVYRRVEEFLAAFRRVGSGASYLSLAVYSALMWFCMYLFFSAIILALNFSLSAGDVLFLYLLLFPIKLLPVKGVANFGTHEAGWLAALTILGMDMESAAVLAFGSHIMFLAVILMTGAIPMIWRPLSVLMDKHSASES